jgi:periplasmic protein TonB
MTRLRKFVPQIAIATVLILVGAAVVAVATQFLGQDAKPQKKVVQVQVFRPPPPPPPVEQPPPPPPEEEVKLPEPEPLADAPDVPDMPGPLGLDADGSAGSDAFGLVGRKGGRDLIGGDGPYRSYAMRVKDALLDYLANRDDVRGSTYSIVVQVWIRDDGQLGRYEIVGSSGNPKLDQSLELALANLTKIGGAPPEGMPQPVRLRIKSRA